MGLLDNVGLFGRQLQSSIWDSITGRKDPLPDSFDWRLKMPECTPKVKD